MGTDKLKEARSGKSGHNHFQVHTLTVLSAAISVYHLLGFIFRSFPPRVQFTQFPL